MYATVRKYAGAQELGDELVQRKDDIERILAGISGFRAYYLARTEDGGVVTVSVFDDRTGAEESSAQAAAYIRENLAGVGASPPEVTTGEVAINF
jgi:hypothetical protein